MSRDHVWLGIAMCVTLVLGSAALGAIEYEGFADTSGLALNGDAATVATGDGVVLRLTPAEAYMAGSVFTDELVDARDFSCYFQFRISEPGRQGVPQWNAEGGADGLVFVATAVSSTPPLSKGGGMGYYGIDRSVGVEFDTWFNPFVSGNIHADSDESHVGVDVNGSVRSAVQTAGLALPQFDDGDLWHVWTDYDGTTLGVRWALTDQRPQRAMLLHEIDIPALLMQDTAYVGFTAATADGWQNHDIVSWQYGAYVPEPATLGMLVIGGLLGLRRSGL